MELVLDANVLFSALIKNSVTSELLFEESLTLYAPDFMIEEFLKYEETILKKTSRKKEEFVMIMHMLQEVITVIPPEEFSDYLHKGNDISPDPNDFIYFALALRLNCGIWSNDKRLKKQKKVKICSTKEVLEYV